MTPAEKLAKYGPVILECNSKSQPDKTYFVRCKDGRCSCNCKGWIFNRESPKRCKHTDLASEEYRKDLVCVSVSVPLSAVQVVSAARAVRKITFDD